MIKRHIAKVCGTKPKDVRNSQVAFLCQENSNVRPRLSKIRLHNGINTFAFFDGTFITVGRNYWELIAIVKYHREPSFVTSGDHMSDTIIEIDVPISVWIFTTDVPFLFRSPIDFLLWHRASILAMFYLNTFITEIYCAYFILYICCVRVFFLILLLRKSITSWFYLLLRVAYRKCYRYGNGRKLQIPIVCIITNNFYKFIKCSAEEWLKWTVFARISTDESIGWRVRV